MKILNRMARLGALGSTSASDLLSPPTLVTSPTPPILLPPDITGTSGSGSGSSTSIAQDIGSIASTAGNVVKGVLQAESAQNAINAQKNLTSALTPGVITMGLAVLAYWLVTKK
jgi:hypothetical protein